MVLEQGALSGKYDTQHPFPADSDRGKTYNPMLPQLEKLNAGLTKVHHVEDTAKAAALELTDNEVKEMEELAANMDINVIRYWEKEMK